MKYRLGDIATVLNGRAYRQDELLSSGKYKVLRVGNFFTSDRWYYSDLELDDNKYCNNGDLLYAWSANFGPRLWKGSKTIFHYHIWKIVPDESKVIKEYLYYLLIKMTETFKQSVHGSVMAHLTKTDMENFIIDVPDLETQKKIIDILSTFDTKIELNEAENDTLDKIVQTQYKKLVTKPSATSYKATDLFDYTSGYSYTSAELVDESSIGMMTIKNFERSGGFKTDGFKPLDPKKKTIPVAELFDIFISCTDVTQNADIIGNAIMLLDKKDYKTITYSMDLVKINPKINRFALYAILSSRDFKNFALGYKSGTTVLHLSKKCLNEYMVLLPDKKELEVFGQAIEKICKKISNNLIENRNLIQMRSILLPRLLSGKIDISRVA